MTVDEFDLLIAYRNLLVKAYPDLKPSLKIEIDPITQYETGLYTLLAVFENHYSMSNVNVEVEGNWEYIDRPNNLMIEAFAETKGKVNSALIYSLFTDYAAAPLSPGILCASEHVKILIPFAGSSLEVPGLIAALASMRPHQNFTVHVSDISLDQIITSQAIYVASLETNSILAKCRSRLEVVFSREDACDGSLDHCDMVIGFHPQVAPALTADRIMWRRIVIRCIQQSKIAMFFTLNLQEARLVQACARQIGRSAYITESSASLPMPRELIKRARSARTGIASVVPRHRYYGFLAGLCL